MFLAKVLQVVQFEPTDTVDQDVGWLHHPVLLASEDSITHLDWFQRNLVKALFVFSNRKMGIALGLNLIAVTQLAFRFELLKLVLVNLGLKKFIIVDMPQSSESNFLVPFVLQLVDRHFKSSILCFLLLIE